MVTENGLLKTFLSIHSHDPEDAEKWFMQLSNDEQLAIQEEYLNFIQRFLKAWDVFVDVMKDITQTYYEAISAWYAKLPDEVKNMLTEKDCANEEDTTKKGETDGNQDQ